MNELNSDTPPTCQASVTHKGVNLLCDRVAGHSGAHYAPFGKLLVSWMPDKRYKGGKRVAITEDCYNV